jgi:hypothetical protein
MRNFDIFCVELGRREFLCSYDGTDMDNGGFGGGPGGATAASDAAGAAASASDFGGGYIDSGEFDLGANPGAVSVDALSFSATDALALGGFAAGVMGGVIASGGSPTGLAATGMAAISAMSIGMATSSSPMSAAMADMVHDIGVINSDPSVMEAVATAGFATSADGFSAFGGGAPSMGDDGGITWPQPLSYNGST